MGKRGFCLNLNSLEPRLADAVVAVQAQAAEEQTTTVKKLRQAVQKGEAEEKELVKAEGMLATLTGSLQYLQAEIETTARGADVAFRRGLLGTQHVCCDFHSCTCPLPRQNRRFVYC
jgi:hypothetical protein